MKVKSLFEFVTCTEAEAISEIKIMLKANNINIIDDIYVYSSTRLLENAHGKYLSEEEFENMNFEDEDAWFDDYRFVIRVIVDTKWYSSTELVKSSLSHLSGFLEGEVFL